MTKVGIIFQIPHKEKNMRLSKSLNITPAEDITFGNYICSEGIRPKVCVLSTTLRITYSPLSSASLNIPNIANVSLSFLNSQPE